MKSILTVLLVGFLSNFSRAQILDPAASKEEHERLMKERHAAWMARRQAYQDSVVKVRKAEAVDRLAEYAAHIRKDTFKVLDLSYGAISKLPKWVFEYTACEELVLNNSEVEKLPGKIKKLTSLKEIEWVQGSVNGKLKVGKSASVKRLKINSVGADRLASFKGYTSLERLNLSANKLSAIPVSQLAKNGQLKELNLGANPLQIDEGKYDRLTTLEVLKLNKCELEGIHTDFYKMPALNELQLQENKLSQLPEGVSEMKKLGKLSLYKNQLTSLPSDLFLLPELTAIDLYYNQLTAIPDEIKYAKKVEVLFAAHNKIYDLPESISELERLEEVYLHHNQLTALPASIGEMSQIKVLRINDNSLVAFPEQILSLVNLTDLDLDNNQFESISEGVGQLAELRLFTFDGNPIDFNDPENQSFMKAVSGLGERGVVCKPSIRMEAVNE